jgi:hypothetical protein
MSRQLVPLRIPSGWTVLFNTFAEIDDAHELTIQEREALLSEDLLQLETEDLVLDLGWYPDEDPEGAYRVELVDRMAESWDVLVRAECPRHEAMAAVIDMILDQLARNASYKFIQELADRHPSLARSTG